jgi:8-oxo-dGTP diphosphatase
VIIARNGKVLLGKRSGQLFQGKWALPGGTVEFGEDFLTAARREVKEETGLDVEIASIVNVATEYLTPDLHILQIVCVAGTASGREAPSDELSELRWIGLEGPFPPMAFESDEHAIRRYGEIGHTGVAADPVFATG